MDFVLCLFIKVARRCMDIYKKVIKVSGLYFISEGENVIYFYEGYK